VVAEEPGKVSFERGNLPGFTVERIGGGGGGGNPELGKLCPGTFTVNAGTDVGPLFFAKGPYLIYIPTKSAITTRRGLFRIKRGHCEAHVEKAVLVSVVQPSKPKSAGTGLPFGQPEIEPPSSVRRSAARASGSSSSWFQSQRDFCSGRAGMASAELQSPLQRGTPLARRP
jgi:hypothetical protein